MNGHDLETKIKRKKTQRIVMAVIAIAIIAAAAIALVIKNKTPEASAKTVTLEIRCDRLAQDPSKLKDEALRAYVPEDGTILAATTYPVTPDKTNVFDILEKACLDNDIQFEYISTPGYGGYYIEGIQYLYEFAAGKNSGWRFSVDGVMPNYGCDKVKLQGGEAIVWFYSVDYKAEDNEIQKQ